jgi:Type VI secretion system effector, Hcp
MGVRRKRRRREEERENEEEREQPQEKERAVATEATPADRVLDLQKTAGNRAVGAAIARWGFPWLPMTAAPQWPKEAQVIADGMVIPISSWSWGEHSPGVGSGTGVGKPAIGSEVSVSTTVGSHSADLALRTAEGRPFKTVFIVVPGKDGTGMTIKLEDVMIASYQTSDGSANSGPVETWSLSFAKKEFSQSPPPQAQPRP